MSYRRYYRRPYYGRRSSSYNKRGSNFFGKFLFCVGVLFLFGILSSSSNINAFFSLVSSLLVIIAFVWVIIFCIKKLLKSPNQYQIQDNININNQDVYKINSEKHGCKCYMEGLSDGEQEVANTLSRELSYKDYFIFNNLIISAENNGSTQIDHVVISKFGIFVIESKDYNGWIFGDKDQQDWTQSLPGGNKFQFQNPIHQNYAHIMALKNLTSLTIDDFHSIVVFSDKSEIKTAPIENVLHLNQLISYIKKYSQQKLTESDIQLIIGKLSYVCQTSDITASDHVANLHAHKNKF